MALVIENGTGLANANSYMSVAEADTFHADRGNFEWAAFDNIKKEQLIHKAMDYITAVFSVAWQGYRSSLNQALDWPRRGVKYAANQVPDNYSGQGYWADPYSQGYGYGGGNGNGSNGFFPGYNYLPYNIIPQLLKDAVADLALIASTTDLMPNQTRTKKKVKVGPLEVEYDSNSPLSTRFISASARLAPFLGGISSSGGMVRLQRS